jgi:hypothetical protein
MTKVELRHFRRRLEQLRVRRESRCAARGGLGADRGVHTPPRAGVSRGRASGRWSRWQASSGWTCSSADGGPLGGQKAGDGKRREQLERARRLRKKAETSGTC